VFALVHFSLAGLQTQKKQAQSFKAVGADINANQVEAMQSQVSGDCRASLANDSGVDDKLSKES
jgi:hypothetical protein